MIRKNILTAVGLTTLVAFTGVKAFAQDVHFTQFNAAPLTVNPALTGAFDGTFRAAAVYRDQWRSVTNGFVTYSASIDGPIKYDLGGDDKMSLGLQFYNDKAGDGNLSNTSILGSLAYTKWLGGGQGDPNKSLSVGFQGGYTSKSIDLSKLYFGDQYDNGLFSGTTAELANNKVNYWTINAGINWAHHPVQAFSYTIGLGANNLNQPREAFEKQANSQVGLGMRYTAQVGAIAAVSQRLRLLPVVLYQTQATAAELVVGNEFNYSLSNYSQDFRSVATNIFAGVFYRANDAIMATAGLEFKGFRFGVSYDYNTSSLKDASKGNGGFEISLRYIAPNVFDFAHRREEPCARF